jgi:hypothetical protein
MRRPPPRSSRPSPAGRAVWRRQVTASMARRWRGSCRACVGQHAEDHAGLGAHPDRGGALCAGDSLACRRVSLPHRIGGFMITTLREVQLGPSCSVGSTTPSQHRAGWGGRAPELDPHRTPCPP